MINLCGNWTLCYDDQAIEIQVPSVIEKNVEKLDNFCNYTYKKHFSLEKNTSKKYLLNCEGISYAYKITLNGKKIANHEGVWEHLILDITDFLENENDLSIEVIRPNFDKTDKYYYRSVLFGFVPDILLPFSGIFRPIYIDEKSKSYFENVRVYANYDNCSIDISGDCVDFLGCKIGYEITSPTGEIFTGEASSKDVSVVVNMIKWSTSNPDLYDVKVNLIKSNEVIDTYTCKRGFRKIEVNGNQILLNGQREYFRGVLHWGYYPEEMSVYASKESILDELKKIKAQGFNAVKFCLFFPENYYYDLCDELGILVWQEMPLWLPFDNGYLIDRIKFQFPRMVKKFIDHPSLLLISIGCELDDTVSDTLLDEIYYNLKSYNSNAIICDNSGSGECYDGTTKSKSDIYDYHFYSEIFDMQNLINSFNHESRDPKPWLFGEFNDMDTFRNLNKVVDKLGNFPFWANDRFDKNLLRYVHQGHISDNPIYNYDKVLKEYGYEASLEKIEEIGLKKAYDVRKFNLETTRLNDGISGYSITTMRDVPITSAGIFDDFGIPKFDNSKMQMINGDVVISMLPKLRRKWHIGGDVLDSGDIFNFLNGSTIDNRVVISSHLQREISGFINVSLSENDKTIYNKDTQLTILPSVSKQYFELAIPTVADKTAIHKYSLKISIGDYSNSWNIWTYPEKYDNEKFYVYDNMNNFENMENILNCQFVDDISSLKDTVLVTTIMNDDVLKLRSNGVKLIYIQNGKGLYDYDKLAFWRENVKIISSQNPLDELNHDGYDSLQFISLSANMAFDSNYVKKLYPNYKSIVKRVDNRNFKTSEIIFMPEDNLCKMAVTSFDFKAGKGVQARSFAKNYLGQGLLSKLLKLVQ